MSAGKWVYLATASDQLEAEMWCNLLFEEGVSAMIRPGDTTSFLGVSAYGTRIQVREHQLDEAREILGDRLEETPE